MHPLLSASLLSASLVSALLVGCGDQTPPTPVPPATVAASSDYYGTLEPFAAEAVYFVLTDRFVNGDPDNDFREQGGDRRSFDIPLPPCDGVSANIGYMGGDFRGLLDHADYIREMGFTAVWITPIVENPDEAFSGGDPISCTSFLSDRGKAAYHGYWGTNFYRVDEHLPSPGLAFADLTRELRAKGLKTVLDIVANHSSPAWTMSEPQPGFGQLFSADGTLIADHQNLPPEQLDPVGNPLHAFYNTRPDLAQLGDFNADNPAVMDYLIGAYLQWIEQGAIAFRVDTIRHQPLHFWTTFAERIREQHPGFFMFGEAFDYEAANIAPHTWDENGRYSLLDFPLKKAMLEVFEQPDGDYAKLSAALHLVDGPYQNPYELTTFYDNHDMARMNASDEGFIDAHHWLFTARGIPVIYYGSEIGFMRGRVEHAGNRNYYGVENIALARSHPIRAKLARIAAVRAESPALQRGLQLVLEMAGDRAAFYRVLQLDGEAQTALVLLNKGDTATEFGFGERLQPGRWRSAMDASVIEVDEASDQRFTVAPHDAAVWLLDAPITLPALRAELDALMAGRERRKSDG
jgi:cyclomaltodextrin glucanotransferase